MPATAADLELSGAALAELQAALVAAFPDRFQFRQLTQYRLDLDLDRIVGEVGVDEVAFTLIEWARARGRLRELVGGARAENPGNPDLKQFADRVGVALPGPAAVPSAEEANRGINALSALLDGGDAREAVRAFERDFQDAVDQIEVLAAFKDVHDLLHTLEFRCYQGLARQASRFPADELARDIVVEHGMTLEETITRLEAITGGRGFDVGRPRWLDDLGEARAQLTMALDTSDPAPLKAAVRVLDRVLAVQPTRINTRLTDAARALRLRDLVMHLRDVHTRLTSAAVDGQKLTEFEAGIASLQQLEGALKQLVVEHDRWQELDVELRLEKNALLIGPEGLEASWPRLRAGLLPLCSGADAWATRLVGDCGRLDAALAVHDAVTQRNVFILVHSQAATRFYQVDLALQSMCERLRHIGQPLAELLARLR
jgi:hypothetical protein